MVLKWLSPRRPGLGLAQWLGNISDEGQRHAAKVSVFPTLK